MACKFDLDTALNSSSFKDWPIIIFSFLEMLLGYLYASAGRHVFKSYFLFPRWIIPACMFNVRALNVTYFISLFGYFPLAERHNAPSVAARLSEKITSTT